MDKQRLLTSDAGTTTGHPQMMTLDVELTIFTKTKTDPRHEIKM